MTVLQGDSGKVLPGLVNTLKDRCLFWLDAHYCGEYAGEMAAKADLLTPIAQELAPILNHSIRDHVILIDDARLFDGNGYPTFAQLCQYIRGIRPDLAVEVSEDIIRIHLPNL